MINEDFLLGYLLSESRYNSEREELIKILKDSHGINVPANASVRQVAQFLGIIELNASYNIRCNAYSVLSPDYRDIRTYDEAVATNKTERSSLSGTVIFNDKYRAINTNCNALIELIPATE